MQLPKAPPHWNLAALAQGFATRFPGETAPRFFASHGRSELGGNHTDHNHGKVIAAALDLPALAAVTPRDDRRVVLASLGWDQTFEVDLSGLEPVKAEEGTTQALIRGVAFFLQASGHRVGGFNALVASQVLPGSGLSSSAAIEVLLACIYNGLYNQGGIGLVDLAITGQKAENRHFGKPCGLMDQMACAHGGVLAIDFADPLRPRFSNVALDLEAQGLALVISDTGGSHADLTGEYAAIPAEMKAIATALGGEVLREVEESVFIAALPELSRRFSHRAVLRAIHFYRENRRVDRMLEALKTGDMSGLLRRVRESGLSSAVYLQNIFPVNHVEAQGVTLGLALSEEVLGDLGAWRVHGGGMAGTIQAWVPQDLVKTYVDTIDRVFGQGSARVLSILNHPAGEVES